MKGPPTTTSILLPSDCDHHHQPSSSGGEGRGGEERREGKEGCSCLLFLPPLSPVAFLNQIQGHIATFSHRGDSSRTAIPQAWYGKCFSGRDSCSGGEGWCSGGEGWCSGGDVDIRSSRPLHLCHLCLHHLGLAACLFYERKLHECEDVYQKILGLAAEFYENIHGRTQAGHQRSTPERKKERIS